MGLLILYNSYSGSLGKILDPDYTTVYPPEANHRAEINGWFAEPGEPARNFGQVYGPNNTYLSFIKSYT